MSLERNSKVWNEEKAHDRLLEDVMRVVELSRGSRRIKLLFPENYGNVVMNLTWNVSNPKKLGGTATWTINNDFQIDDDKVYSGSSADTLMKFANLSSTRKSFFPATGLQRCTNSNCNIGAYPEFIRNETLATYFHIRPPEGLQSGTYSTTVWIVTNGFP